MPVSTLKTILVAATVPPVHADCKEILFQSNLTASNEGQIAKFQLCVTCSL